MGIFLLALVLATSSHVHRVPVAYNDRGLAACIARLAVTIQIYHGS